MLHEDRGDSNTVLVERVDLDRLHRRRGRGIDAPLASTPRSISGTIAVVGYADLVREHVGRDVLARFVGDPDVDVVGECFEQLPRQHANPGRRRIRKQDRNDPFGREHRDRQSGFAGAVHIDAIRRPEAQHQVDVVDDVITVQMGEEDRTHGAAALRLAFGMHRDPRPPGLTVHSFTAIDDVGNVADDDGVRVTGARRFGIRCPSGAEQDRDAPSASDRERSARRPAQLRRARR